MGDYHSLFLSDMHILYGCGLMYALGMRGDDDDDVIYHEIVNLSEILFFPHSFSKPIREIECAGLTSYFIDDEDRVYGVGENDEGQLGFAVKEQSDKYFEKVTKLNIPNRIKQFACGHNHVCLMDEECNVITFGYNEYGQCGVPKNHKLYKRLIDEPVIINSFFDRGANGGDAEIDDEWKIICGYISTYIIDGKYNVYCCGENRCGQCLIAGSNMLYVPTFMSNETITGKFTEGKRMNTIVSSNSGVHIITE